MDIINKNLIRSKNLIKKSDRAIINYQPMWGTEPKNLLIIENLNAQFMETG